MQGIALLEKAASSEQLNDARKAKVQFGLCLGYFQTGQMEKAQNACKKALEYDSHFMPAQKLLQEISKRKPSIASE
jgi:Tfp pilus assembly protein PilF